MRAKDFIRESVTFGVAKSENRDGRMYYSNPFEKLVNSECWVCDGTGKDPYHPGHECDMCKGEGTLERWESEAGELNVANANASVLLQMLGLDNSDWAGVIENKDLPNIRRKIIWYKNKGVGDNTREPSDTQNTRIEKDPNGMSRIGKGPRMMVGGLSEEQINRYFDELLKIVDFAQKNGLDVTWA